MAAPQTLTLRKSDVNKVVRLYEGNKRTPGIGARTIAETTGFARRQVMLALENAGVANFSEGSYA